MPNNKSSIYDYKVARFSDWENVVAFSTETHHAVGLCSDGTIVAIGNNKDGQCNVETWSSIGTGREMH